MRPLLGFYESVDIDTASVHAATLEEVTYSKVLRNGAFQAASTLKGGTNKLLKWSGVRYEVDATPPQSTAEKVMERAKYWQCKPTSVPQNEVLRQLSMKLKLKSTEINVLSRRVIEEAAEGMNISTDLLLTQQAEAVADRYLKDCMEGVQEVLRKQGREQAVMTEEILSKHLEDLSPEQKIEIQKSLGIQDLSGKSLRSTFLKSGVPLVSIAAMQASGFGAYLALSTVIHAVFTSFLGITLPFAAYTTAASGLSVLTGPLGILLSLGVGALGYLWGQRKIERSQCAMVVFACVCKAGWAVVPRTDTLPSAQGMKLLGSDASSSVETPPNQVIRFKELSDSHAQSQEASQEYSRAERQLEEERKKRLAAERRLQATLQQLAASEQKTSEGTFTKSAMEHVILTLQRSKNQLESEVRQSKLDIERYEVSVASLRRKVEQAQSRHEAQLERLKSELQQMWAIHFPQIAFSNQSMKWAAEQDFQGRIEIERALRELADAEDPVQLSRSKMHGTGEHHSGFTIPNGVPCRIFYTARGRNISISRMCKRKDC